jgi:hypothetical protein
MAHGGNHDAEHVLRPQDVARAARAMPAARVGLLCRAAPVRLALLEGEEELEGGYDADAL